MNYGVFDSGLMMTVNECLKDDELVDQFCRLSNVERPDRISPINKMIDEACGRNTGSEFFDKFINFVDEFIYQPMLVESEK